jgi:hypothetical protein
LQSLRVAIEPAVNPRIGDVSAEGDPAVTILDKVLSGPKGSFEVIKAHLVETMLPFHSHDIVAEGNKRHVDGFDSAEEVWINCSCEDHSVDQPVFQEDRRQVNPLRRDTGGIMKRRKEDVLLDGARIRFDALQDTGVKGMEEITVAQEKANHFRALP